MKSFRIFTNDVGPNAYSCWKLVEAPDAQTAIKRVKPWPWEKVLAIVDTSAALALYGPNGRTGKLPHARVLDYGRRDGDVAGPMKAI